ncbi:UNVERIFIED_ORG: DUF4192 domain-containing protein [Bacillus sp. AZ43]
MDAGGARRTHPDPGPVVRLDGAGEFAEALPHLLGFRPRESVVLVGLSGPGGRVGLTIRADLPAVDDTAALAAALTRKLLTDAPDAVLVAVVSEEPDAGPAGLPHRALPHAVVVALAAHDVPVREAVLVRSGRWWSYDCPAPCCAPGAGTPLPSGVSALAAASVAGGVVVASGREALAARIAPWPARARAAMATACAAVGVACAREIDERGWDAAAEESWAAVVAALARSRPGASGTLPDAELARVLWALRDRGVRDRALGLALGGDAAAAEQLWTECTRRAPAPLHAAPATLLAVSAWLRGDGAMAQIALDRALDGAPDYALAHLLSQALDGCVRPAELRELIAAAVAAGED